jgi:tRNA (adenine57-N1/adenine58-N1)-methyltransferase
VGAQGRIITYDNRLEHLSVARSNIERFGLENSWYPVLGDGRRFVGSSFADAACMDIPDPWNALRTCWDALRPGGMLASYSPTVNQTEQTVTEALKLPFMFETSFEVMLRRIVVSPGATRHSFEGPGHTGYISLFRRLGGNK